MEKISLKEIARAVNSNIDSEIYIDEICTDTRKIKEGSLFIAIKGENFDGHDFIEQAFEKGAAAVISSRKIERENVVLVADTKRALLDLARYYLSRFSVFTVGVTGSVGKTSTKEMIYSILSYKAKTLKTEGNFNNEIGMPMTIFNIDASYKNAVFEMGMSDFGEILDLTKVARPNAGVITNIGVSHIETLGSRENILKAKLEIAEGMGHDAPLILNKDDKLLETVSMKLDRPVIYYGIDNKTSDVVASDIKSENGKTSFDISFFGRTIKASIPTVGRHNVLNALAGFCVGLVAEMEAEEIVKAMKDYQNSGMRQNISKIGERTVIADCYNASPDSMKSAIDVITSLDCEGKRVCVFGDMLELGELTKEAHLEVGKKVGRDGRIDMLLCYGERAEDIKRGAMQIGMKNVRWFKEKDELTGFILNNVKKGDAIIYKASRGMKLEEVMNAVNKEWENE